MKKLASVLASALLLFPLSANAAVHTNVHSGVTTYSSQVANSNHWSAVELRRASDNSSPTIMLGMTDTRDYLFSNKAKLVIDDAVSNLKLANTYRSTTEYRTLKNSRGIYELTATQAEALKEAKNVSLQISFDNSSTVNWKVPARVLNEWQEVLTKNK